MSATLKHVGTAVHTGSSVFIMSKEQEKLISAIRTFYPLRLDLDKRPDHLKNIKTGKNLEVDIFMYEHGVCVEYQGMIHFKYIERYKNNPDRSRELDTLKNDMLDGFWKLPLIEVFPQDLNGDIKENFLKRLLITLEDYYNRQKFKKCKRLERLYLYIKGVKNTISVSFFHLCNDIQIGKWKPPLIGNLLAILKEDKLFHDGRHIFKHEIVSRLLKFEGSFQYIRFLESLNKP